MCVWEEKTTFADIMDTRADQCACKLSFSGIKTCAAWEQCAQMKGEWDPCNSILQCIKSEKDI